MNEPKTLKHNYTFPGYLAIVGAISMFIGAAFWASSGTDLWETLATNQMENYLGELASVKQLLVINTSFWILGVLLLGSAGQNMVEYCKTKSGLAKVASFCIQTAVPVAIVAFIIMLSLAIYQPATETAYSIGWIGARLDDLATALLVGFFPFIISMAGKEDWVPNWLRVFGIIAGLAGILVIVSLYTGIVFLGFIIIPVGLGWMIAAGVVLIRIRHA